MSALHTTKLDRKRCNVWVQPLAWGDSTGRLAAELVRGSASHRAHAGELLPEDYALAKPRKLDQMMAEAADRLHEATRAGGPLQQLTVMPGAELANGDGNDHNPPALAEVAPPPPPADDVSMEQAPPPPPPG